MADEKECICSEFKNKADFVEVKHGEWIGLECSVCGHFATYAKDYNYCPHCGAKMKGED